ncbi:hypothetical protein FB558_5082 [Pseudonocardia kunmingensis]|uniref:Uncharacterized protein n=1 Tax=Pseudonocardia kunmingensis TaxID=630975 RepID=A0A543DJ11_9PSEU|nr:hypothetical protein FB558_5082 [Pseudonocardia kunmingensis]
MHSEVRSGSQADLVGDAVDRQPRALQEFAGGVHPRPEDPLQRGAAGLLGEAAQERAGRHPRVCGESGDGELLVEPRHGPFARRGEGFAMGCRAGLRQVLGLTPGPVGRGDESSCDLVRRAHAEVAPNDVQAQVETGGGPRRGEDGSLVDEEHVRLDRDLRMPLRELLRRIPVRRRPQAVEQAGIREGECAVADRRDACPAGCAAPERFAHLHRYRPTRRGVPRDDDRVRVGQCVQAPRDRVAEASVGRHRSGGDPADRHLVGEPRLRLEHLRRDPDIQRERPVEYEDHHPMRSLHHPTPIRSTRANVSRYSVLEATLQDS